MFLLVGARAGRSEKHDKPRLVRTPPPSLYVYVLPVLFYHATPQVLQIYRFVILGMT